MMVKDRDFEEKVLDSDVPVLVEFWGSWCPPCQQLKYVMKSLGDDYRQTMKIMTMNIDRNPSTARKLNIKGVPAFVIFNGGDVIHRDIGSKSEHQIRQMIAMTFEKISSPI